MIVNCICHTVVKIIGLPHCSRVHHMRAQYTTLSVGVLQQLAQNLDNVQIGLADDLELLVASWFCIAHPDRHRKLQGVAILLLAVLQWWKMTWQPRPQWRLALHCK